MIRVLPNHYPLLSRVKVTLFWAMLQRGRAMLLLAAVLSLSRQGQGFHLSYSLRQRKSNICNRAPSAGSYRAAGKFPLPHRGSTANNAGHKSDDNIANNSIILDSSEERGAAVEGEAPMTRRALAKALLVGTGAAGVALVQLQQQPAPAAAVEAAATASTGAAGPPLNVLARNGGSTVEDGGLGPRPRQPDAGGNRSDPPTLSSAADTIGGAAELPPVGTRSKRIFLARHGQTDLNALMICQGRRLNPPLNGKGRAQARRLLTGTALGGIVCSPLRRARDTAECVRESHPGVDISILGDLNEVDFGGAEGLPQPLSAAFLAPTYMAWSQGQLGVHAGRFGESGDELRRRSAAAAAALLDSCDEGGQVLGVSHSSMIKFMLAYLLDVPLGTIRTLGQSNCAVNAMDYDTVSGVFEAVVINGNAVRGRVAGFARSS